MATTRFPSDLSLRSWLVRLSLTSAFAFAAANAIIAVMIKYLMITSCVYAPGHENPAK